MFQQTKGLEDGWTSGQKVAIIKCWRLGIWRLHGRATVGIPVRKDGGEDLVEQEEEEETKKEGGRGRHVAMLPWWCSELELRAGP